MTKTMQLLWLAFLTPLAALAADPADISTLEVEAATTCDNNAVAFCARTRIILDHEDRILENDAELLDHETRLLALEAVPEGFVLPAECAPAGPEITDVSSGFIKILQDPEILWMQLSDIRWWFVQDADNRVFVNIEGFARVVAIVSGDAEDCLEVLLDAIGPET